MRGQLVDGRSGRLYTSCGGDWAEVTVVRHDGSGLDWRLISYSIVAKLLKICLDLGALGIDSFSRRVCGPALLFVLSLLVIPWTGCSPPLLILDVKLIWRECVRMDWRQQVGEIGEAEFVSRAMRMGLKVARPLSSREGYDYIVDNGRRCSRVQVKATETRSSKTSYHINAGKGQDQKTAYGWGEIDFFVIIILPEDTWFILPWAALQGRVGLSIPSVRRGNFGAYEEHYERWDLLI